MIHAQIVPESDIDYMRNVMRPLVQIEAFWKLSRRLLEPTPQQAATLPKREGEREEMC